MRNQAGLIKNCCFQLIALIIYVNGGAHDSITLREGFMEVEHQKGVFDATYYKDIN